MKAYKIRINKLINLGLIPMFIVSILFLCCDQFMIDPIEERENKATHIFRYANNDLEKIGNDLLEVGIKSSHLGMIIFEGKEKLTGIKNLIPSGMSIFFFKNWDQTDFPVLCLRPLLFSHRDNKANQLHKTPIFSPLIC